MERRSSNIAASSAKSHQMPLILLQSSSFGFNSSCTMRLQPVLVAACFLAAFCYFFLLLLFFFSFFPGACELQGQAKVKLYHFSDEMQADVAVSCDTVSALPCWGLWWCLHPGPHPLPHKLSSAGSPPLSAGLFICSLCLAMVCK